MVGFEPTPFRTGALNQRLRPLGHATLPICNKPITVISTKKYFADVKNVAVAGRIRTYAGKPHWISSPTP